MSDTKIPRARRLAVLAPLALSLLLPSCGNNQPTLPDVIRAGLVVSVTPSPVPPSQNVLSGVISIGYLVTITEVLGLGGEILFVSAQVYDPETGLPAAPITYFDGNNLIVFVGTNRIEAGGTMEVPQSTSYVLPDFRVNALLAVNVQMRDDRDNLVNQSILVKIEPPAEAVQ